MAAILKGFQANNDPMIAESGGQGGSVIHAAPQKGNY
jgi:hypothetical protein